jgi:hypothetical protein
MPSIADERRGRLSETKITDFSRSRAHKILKKLSAESADMNIGDSHSMS